jgi:hypothetical protein
MAGYIRQRATEIADGNNIYAGTLNAEYDALHAAFHAASGHRHDGTDAEGARITQVGPSGEVVVEAGTIRPRTSGVLSLGTTALRYSTAWFTAPITVGTPTANDHAATKLYVDTADALKVPLAGGTMTGTLTAPRLAVDANYYMTLGTNAAVLGFDAQDYMQYNRNTDLLFVSIAGGLRFSMDTTAAAFTVPLNLPAAAPTTATHATHKAYVDSLAAARLPLTGGTVAGNLAVSGTLTVTGAMTTASPILLPDSDPSLARHAARKSYVDWRVEQRLPMWGGELTGDLILQQRLVTPAGNMEARSDHKARTWSDGGWEDRWVNGTGNRTWNRPGGNAQMTLDFGGNLYTMGSNNGSDKRIKDVGGDVSVETALEFVNLTPRMYQIKHANMDGSSGPVRFGWIAQEVAAKPSLAPMVGRQPYSGLTEDSSDGSPANYLLTLDSGLAAPALLAVALKHALARIDALEARLSA